MVDDHNPDYIESKPLNTEMETLAPEAQSQTLPLTPALVAAAKAWSSVTPRAQLETLAAALSDPS